MLSIESTAKTVKQAIEDGLKKLNKSIDEVEVKIISQPGIFRKAKVLITVEGLEPPKPEVKQDRHEAKPVKSEPQLNRQEQSADKRAERERPARLEKPLAENKGEGKDDRFARLEKPATENKGEDREDRHSRGRKDRHAKEKQAQDGQAQDKAQETQSTPVQKQSEPQRKSDNGGQREPRQKNDFRQRTGDNDRFDKRTDGRRDERRDRDSRETEPREHKEREYREITDEAATTAADFVEGLLSRMNVAYSMLRKRENGALLLDITSESGAIIGYRGETLDSIEYLASLTVNRNSDKYYRIGVDCNGYRIKREEMLAAMAVRLADKAVRTQRKVMMEPMNNFSRKVVHSALADNDKIFTRSEGTEPNRHIVIIPKRNR